MKGSRVGRDPSGSEPADYVVVGSGSAGAIVARRLADTGAAVTLIESGRQRRGPLVTIPGMCGTIHAVTPLQRLVTWPAYSVPQRHMKGRKLPQSHGRILGGGSVINGMAFVRGNRQNYDVWAADGAKGWGFSEVLPCFRRLESFEDGPSDLRGGDGPIAVERATGLASVTESFMAALAATAGVGMNDDYNGAQHAGVAPLQQSAGAGRRVGTDRGYLWDAPLNLRVLTGVTGTRVMVEAGRAVGVELIAGRNRRPISHCSAHISNNELFTVPAGKRGGQVWCGVVADIIAAADDADIVDFLGAATDVRRMISTLTTPVAREYGISERALGIVFLVHAGLDRPGLLIDYLNVLPSTITSDIDKLVAAGLLRRTPSDDDRRVTRIEVTPRGVAAQQDSLRQLHDFFRANAAGMALEELHACIATLRKLSGVPQSLVPNPHRKAGDARS